MNKQTYKRILAENKDRVYSYAFYILHNREDAEDITQDVFIRLWQNLEKIEMKTLVGWMMRVTHNCCIDHIRRKKASVVLQKQTSDIEPDMLESAMGPISNPETQVEFSENQQMLLNAMDTLPDVTRGMLLLHYFHGFKLEDISEIVDAKMSTVKVTIHRARKKLKEILADQFPEKAGKQHEYAM